MKYMLDTNILIYFIKNKPPAVADHINALGSDATLCMSFVTFSELLLGAERSTKKARVLGDLNELTRIIPVWYELDHSVCEHYAVQFAKLRAAGTPIGANDLWIACHALAKNCILVTNNTREFQRIDGLRLENWVA